ncbi:MAG: HEPN domain-containing protein [Chloroflexota bacterium]|nr:HEPN domain-containing protein [Chloroflexota bacterium]
MRRETEPWWRQSQADMAIARDLIHPRCYYASAWYVHQAVEKGLKALHIERYDRWATYTQDLLYLGTVLALSPDLMVHIQVIDPAFKFTRYPDTIMLIAPVDGVTEATALKHLRAAEEVLTWLEAQLLSNSIQQ